MPDIDPLPTSAQRSYRPSYEVTDRIPGPVIMMIQLSGWKKLPFDLLPHHLPNWYRSIVHTAKKSFTSTSLKIYVESDSSSARYREFCRCLVKVDNSVTIWASGSPYESAKQFESSVIMQQELGATFVLVTDEVTQADGIPTWQKVIEKNHDISMQIIRYIRHDSMAPRGRAMIGQNFAAIGGQIYRGKPLCNVYSPGVQTLLSKKPLFNKDTLIDQDGATTGNTVTGLVKVQANRITPKGDVDVDQPVVTQSVVVESAAVQATEAPLKAEDEIEPDAARVAVSEKAGGKIGDDFLDFLERALAFYNKV